MTKRTKGGTMLLVVMLAILGCSSPTEPEHYPATLFRTDPPGSGQVVEVQPIDLKQGRQDDNRTVRMPLRH